LVFTYQGIQSAKSLQSLLDEVSLYSLTESYPIRNHASNNIPSKDVIKSKRLSDYLYFSRSDCYFVLIARNYISGYREPVPDLTKDLIGKLFGDRGYISQEGNTLDLSRN
jgi:hypothetical protein